MLAFCLGAIAVALVVERDEGGLHPGHFNGDAVLEPDVEGQEASAATSELGDGLTRLEIQDAFEASLVRDAPRTSWAAGS